MPQPPHAEPPSDGPGMFSDEQRALPTSADERLDRGRILAALDALNAELSQRNRHATVAIVGGAALALVYEARKSTRDVDAWLDDPALVKDCAQAVAARLRLPADWLSDAVRDFIPASPTKYRPWLTKSHLTVLVAQPQALLAMKLLAMRAKDLRDIRFLMRHLGLQGAAQAETVFRAFYGRPLDHAKALMLAEALDHDDRR